MKYELIGITKKTEKTKKYYAVPENIRVETPGITIKSIKTFFNRDRYFSKNKPIKQQFYFFDTLEEAKAFNKTYSTPCEVIVSKGTEYIEGNELRLINPPADVAGHSKISEKNLRLINFKPSDSNVIILRYRQNKDWISPITYPVSYKKLEDSVKADNGYLDKITKLYSDYAAPSYGWFLTGHWHRSKDNIKFVKETLLPAFQALDGNIANDPKKLADWLMDQIHNAQTKDSKGNAVSIKMNPEGSFMRRTKYIIEQLTNAPDKVQDLNNEQEEPPAGLIN